VECGSERSGKRLLAGIFAQEWSSPGETARLAAAAGIELVARGYHARVQTQDDGVALFQLDGGRRPIRQHNGQFVIGDETFAPSSLIQQATTAPETFSPNVLLRPIVQDTLLP